MHFNLNDDDELSIKKFEKMLKTNQVGFFDSDEFEEIIDHYLEVGKMNLARKAIKLGMSQHPTATGIQLLYAEILVFDDLFIEANAILDGLYERDPTNAEIYIQKANIFSKQDNHNTAIELLKMALSYTDDKGDVHNLLGMEFLFTEDYSNAKVNFLECIKLDDTDYSSLYNAIYCFDFLKEHEDAIIFLNAFLDKNPYSEVAWHQVGKQYYELRMYEKALASYEFAIISDEFFIGAYLEKGKVLEKLNRIPEAIENYVITLELDDPTSFALLRLGKCHLKLGNNEKALKYFKKTIKEDPLLEKGWIAITDYYSKKGDYRKALKLITEATEIDADNAFFWVRYAQLNMRFNLVEDAEYGYRKAIELGNFELETWINRSDMLLRLGELDALVTNLEQGLALYPEHVELEFRLAGAFYSTGEHAKGRFYLENALKTDAEFKIIVQELYPQLLENTEVIALLN
jgi:tetratricopeptide (TPR) repeat protein